MRGLCLLGLGVTGLCGAYPAMWAFCALGLVFQAIDQARRASYARQAAFAHDLDQRRQAAYNAEAMARVAGRR